MRADLLVLVCGSHGRFGSTCRTIKSAACPASVKPPTQVRLCALAQRPRFEHLDEPMLKRDVSLLPLCGDEFLIAPRGVRSGTSGLRCAAQICGAAQTLPQSFHCARGARPSSGGRWWSGQYDVTGGLIETKCVHSPIPDRTSRLSGSDTLRRCGRRANDYSDHGKYGAQVRPHVLYSRSQGVECAH